jgi:hypothetical protein
MGKRMQEGWQPWSQRTCLYAQTRNRAALKVSIQAIGMAKEKYLCSALDSNSIIFKKISSLNEVPRLSSSMYA